MMMILITDVGKSVKMLNKLLRTNIRFMLWLFFNIVILMYGIYLRSIAPDGAIVFAYLMYLISFPLGIVVPFVFFCIDRCIGYNINAYYDSFPIIIDIFIPWTLFLLTGYLQWFILIPKIKKYWREKKV